MQAYKATFIKKDGSEREMFFCRLKDIPNEFITSRLGGNGDAKNYPEGMELVWDLEADNFRVFNWKTTTESPREIYIPDKYFDDIV